MPNPRQAREEAERVLISPPGILAANSRGRPRDEEPCEIRTCFQRDIDRITHSKAFRRLKHKTQVFLQPEGDHYRTRLTHTLEVSRIARTVARAVRLNEDLTEAMALGHDLGHTPFGHAGERALNQIFEDGFLHYEQSLRVVDTLEKNGVGLNLCHETRMGILNHTVGVADESEEGRLVRYADKIAYINHDADDAIRAGILKEEELPDEVIRRLGDRSSRRINSLVVDIIDNSSDGYIKMSPLMEETVKIFRDFMFKSVYTNSEAKSEESKVYDILKGIWEYYVNHPSKLPEDFGRIAGSEGIERAVCDYVSGMTDKFAVGLYSELFIPKAWKLFS